MQVEGLGDHISVRLVWCDGVGVLRWGAGVGLGLVDDSGGSLVGGEAESA